eukprot:scaffold2.g6903.t1
MEASASAPPALTVLFSEDRAEGHAPLLPPSVVSPTGAALGSSVCSSLSSRSASSGVGSPERSSSSGDDDLEGGSPRRGGGRARAGAARRQRQERPRTLAFYLALAALASLLVLSSRAALAHHLPGGVLEQLAARGARLLPHQHEGRGGGGGGRPRAARLLAEEPDGLSDLLDGTQPLFGPERVVRPGAARPKDIHQLAGVDPLFGSHDDR